MNKPNTFPTPHAETYRIKRAEVRRDTRIAISNLRATGAMEVLDAIQELGQARDEALKALEASYKQDRINARLRGYEPAAKALLTAEARKIVHKYPDLTRQELIDKVNEMGRGRAPIIEGQDGLPLWVNRKMRGGRSL